MSLTAAQKTAIETTIKRSIRAKLKNYNPETNAMPFHYRLLGKDRMALYSFIQSLNTTFGTSIFEPVAVTLAQSNFKVVKSQAKPYNQISEEAHHAIQHIIDNLATTDTSPNKMKEIETLRDVCSTGKMNTVKLTHVDVWLEKNTGELFLLDLKTAKPNKGNFEKFKRMLLEWTAAEFARNPEVNIHTIIAIPYNPYEPKPYRRWTMKGMLDVAHELLVGEELWDFIGGEGAYNDLLDCFERVGIDLRPEIDAYFSRFK